MPGMDMPVALRQRKGRGAASNASGRFEAEQRVAFDDGWGIADEEPAPLTTTLTVDTTRTIIARNDSPDIGFDRSINPYRGCEHGCVYCYARPSHAYLGLSPGLDFESRLFYKPQAATLLAAELRKKGYSCGPIALGSNTDPYQPVERRLGITRAILEVLRDFRHPVTIVSKAALIQRDLDILGDMAKDRLASVTISVTTLDRTLARCMEPRAPTPERRLETIAALASAGVPTGGRRDLGGLYVAAAAARTEGPVQGVARRIFPEESNACALACRANPRRPALRLVLVEAHDRYRTLCGGVAAALRARLPEAWLRRALNPAARYNPVPAAAATRRAAGSVVTRERLVTIRSAF